MRIHARTHAHAHTISNGANVLIDTDNHTYTHARTHTHTCTYAHACTHAHVQTHLHLAEVPGGRVFVEGLDEWLQVLGHKVYRPPQHTSAVCVNEHVSKQISNNQIIKET